MVLDAMKKAGNPERVGLGESTAAVAAMIRATASTTRNLVPWGGTRLLGIALLALAAGQANAAPAAADILRTKCGACHLEGGKLQRITNLRKSPEGWDMTIARMRVWHKIEVSKEERQILVKYLSDTQGLAPEESAAYRFLLERKPNAQDLAPSEDLAQMCGRCHSYGRVALQRRNADEWGKLVHTHLGQFPSIEYSAMGRDRNWRDLAFAQVVPKLAELYPLNTDAWKAWLAHKPVAPVGSWRVVGHRPGWGDYAGYMRVKARADRYEVEYELNYAAGNRVSGSGQAILYTGYEWRGDARLGNQPMRSVFALSKNGQRLAGRWFLRDADEVGASFTAVRGDAVPRGTILSVVPALLKAGSETAVTVHGVQLGKVYDFGPGIDVLAAEPVSAHEVKLRLRVAAEAAPGVRSVRSAHKGGGKNAGEGQLAVYRQIDSLRVEPELGVARVGGGTNPPLTAQFEAIAYLNGVDGKPGTADDLRLGQVPATWRVDNFDEKAKAADDVRFAGVMEPNGQFLPSFAGPNPARKGLNNVGDLRVIASVADGEQQLSSNGRLVVTVQRWNTPPLR
jgi:quinohemoprotein amine dehydrogenase